MTAEHTPEETGMPRFDRRRRRDDSPMAVLTNMPALTLLSRLSVPMLAVAQDGTIFYANEAFAATLGYANDAISSLTFIDLFESAAEAQTAGALDGGHADALVRLLHKDGGVIRACMSKSLLQRADDPVALVVFQDFTELLWIEGR